MRHVPWAILAAIAILYLIAVAVVGFPPYFGLAIHFTRTTLVFAVLLMYFPTLVDIFTTTPYRNRDYLLAGIILTELSNTSFSIWNEMHRQFGVDNDIFTSPTSAFFSLLLIIGAIMFLRAADVEGGVRWAFVLLIALLFGVSLVFVAPMFR